jgi:hypothetical protein
MVHPALGTGKPATKGSRAQIGLRDENRRHTGFEHLIQPALGHRSGRSARARLRAGASGSGQPAEFRRRAADGLPAFSLSWR